MACQVDRSSALPAVSFPLPLETARLRMRAFVEDDAPAIYAVHGDEEASRYMGGTLTSKQSLENLRALIKRVDETGYGPFAVLKRSAGSAIGWAGVQQLPGYPLIEVLFAFRRTEWGNGYATEVSRALVAVCFDTLGLSEVVATVDDRNHASIHVLEKNGFKFAHRIQHKLAATEGIMFRCTPQQFAAKTVLDDKVS